MVEFSADIPPPVRFPMSGPPYPGDSGEVPFIPRAGGDEPPDFSTVVPLEEESLPPGESDQPADGNEGNDAPPEAPQPAEAAIDPVIVSHAEAIVDEFPE